MATKKQAVATLAAALPDDPRVVRYGFIHDKTKANEALGVADCVDDTFFVVFDSPTSSVIVDVAMGGHTYSVVGPAKDVRTVYWRLGTAKENTQFDFVDQKPVSEDTEPWPTLGDTATVAVHTYTGGTDTYPTEQTEVLLADGSAAQGLEVSVTETGTDVTSKEEEKDMADNETAAMVGCQFDAATAEVVHGKKLLVLVTSEKRITAADGSKEISQLLCGISGEQSNTFSIEAETSEASTKDGNGEWVTKTQGQKSWSASVDGLFSLDSEGRAEIMAALKNGTQLCYGLYMREIDGDQRTYTPVRKGVAYVTGDEIDAPSDDNATFSLSFEGTGEPWLYETASDEERKAGTIVIDRDI